MSKPIPAPHPFTEPVIEAVCSRFNIERELLESNITHSTVAIPRNVCLMLMYGAGQSAREAGAHFNLTRSAARKQIINTRREMEASAGYRETIETLANDLEITLK